MKKKIIILVIALAVLVGLISLATYLLSFKNVSFLLDADVSILTIYSPDGKQEFNKITSSQVVRLQTGNYSLAPSGDKISTDKTLISITKDTEININPNYSQAYLLSQLPSAETNILSVLKSKYPTAMNSYSLQNGELFIKGEWYGGLLVNNESSFNNMKDLYRFIANKDESGWQIINYPELILTKKAYQNVPIDILNTINKLQIDY